jgi:hypothetical protein
MKDALPWLVRWGRVVKETFILPWLLWSAIIIYEFPQRTLFQFMCPHRQAARAGNRAGPPVSESVSPVNIVQQTEQAAMLGRLSLSVCLWWSLFFVHLSSLDRNKKSFNFLPLM